MSRENLSPEEFAMLHVRPWVRFWARMLDIMLYSTILALLFPINANFSYLTFKHLAFPWHQFIHQLAAWGLLSLAAYILFESILLAVCGTTLGKWLFKISLRDAQSQTLSFVTALKRTFLVYFRGFALLLPFISLITLIYAYAALSSSHTTSWDKECHTTISHQRVGFLRIVVFLILFFALSDLKNSAMGMNGVNIMMFKEKIMYVCGIRG